MGVLHPPGTRPAGLPRRLAGECQGQPQKALAVPRWDDPQGDPLRLPIHRSRHRRQRLPFSSTRGDDHVLARSLSRWAARFWRTMALAWSVGSTSILGHHHNSAEILRLQDDSGIWASSWIAYDPPLPGHVEDQIRARRLVIGQSPCIRPIGGGFIARQRCVSLDGTGP